jgi:glycosyltransferase involved in cell wall biosynthesis
VLSQSFADFEVLIGDETGDFAPTVRDLHDDRIDYRHNPERLGYAGNHVSLLDRALGRYMAVLHDDDWWEPTYLASMVEVLESDPSVGVVTCDIRRDIAGDSHTAGAWPVPLRPGRNAEPLDLLVREEWFLLPTSSMWRREVWQGDARAWPLDLHASELQLYLSAAEKGWAFYYLPTCLAHWVQHNEQWTTHLGGDYGLAVADDVLEYWDRWLNDRPERYALLSRRQRANTQLRRARALLLLGDRDAAREALSNAKRLVGTGGDGYARLAVAVRLPTPVIRAGITAKRSAMRALGLLHG